MKVGCFLAWTILAAGEAVGSGRGMLELEVCEVENPRTTVVLEERSGDGCDSSDCVSEFLDGDCDSVVVEPERCNVACAEGT